jgi:predicted MPP superfamily phosphohydrolase
MGLARPMPLDPASLEWPVVDWNDIARRLGPDRLAHRLKIQIGHSANTFRLAAPHRYLENLFFLQFFATTVLRMTGLYARARRNYFDLQIRTHPVVLPRLDPVFNGFTLLHLSDLHGDLDPEFIPNLIEKLRSLTFDGVVITGDFRSRINGDPRPCLQAMGRLTQALARPVYGVLGNHDAIEMLPGLTQRGIHILLNDALLIRRGSASLALAGTDDPHGYKTDDLNRARAGIPPGLPSILLAHSADAYQKAEAMGFDLMLCGHTHAGQICLPGGIPLVRNSAGPRFLFTGPWHYRRLRGYTSAGTGASGIPVRLNTRPEAVLHRLLSHH